MNRKRKRILLIILLLIGFGFVVLNVVAYRQAYTMMHFVSNNSDRTKRPEDLSLMQKAKLLFTGINMPRTKCDILPSQFHPACQQIFIPNDNTITLAAWYVNAGADTPLVILFHGYSSDKTAHIQEALTFLDLGASILLVDFRGSGDSSESYTTIGVHEAEDVATVMDYVQKTLPNRKVILFGQSMGAAAILRAVHEYDLKPSAIILEAVFDTLLNAIRNRFDAMGFPSFPSAELMVFWGGQQSNFNGFTHKPIEYAKSVTCPILFMHGAEDPRAKLSEATRVYHAVEASKELIVFANTGHNAYVLNNARKWRCAVQPFLESSQNITTDDRKGE